MRNFRRKSNKIVHVSIFIIFFIILLLPNSNYSQIKKTKISQIEIDGKKYNGNYKVFFPFRNEIFEGKVEENGFSLPAILNSESKISVQIVLGNFRLNFASLPILRFDNRWTLKIYQYPFSKIEIDKKEKRLLKLVYLLQFDNGGEILYKVRKNSKKKKLKSRVGI